MTVPASPPPYDLAPLLPVMALGAMLALIAVAWVWRRRRSDARRPGARLRALTALTLFLTFDLVLFGAFTRLTDSGLGCPDWPGCYGTASPVGAEVAIEAAQTALPGGPVSHGKAWIEMIHRYLATAVGGLIALLTAASWLARARRSRAAFDDPRVSAWWATATLGWVCLQGAFGALTVTLKLYPAIVTAHLLGGFGLLALLAVQTDRPSRQPVPMSPALFAATLAVAALAVLQAALGGWVSSNYAVLACRDFPTCQGSFWPAMQFGDAFALRRGLGVDADGGYLPFAALTAIHVAHRLGAGVLLVAIGVLSWRFRAAGDARLRGWSIALFSVVAWQVLSGLANVVLGWPVVAALAHTGGAAALLALLAVLISRAETSPRQMSLAELPMQRSFQQAP